MTANTATKDGGQMSTWQQKYHVENLAIRVLTVTTVLLFSFLVATCTKGTQPNSVVTYLSGAERQSETDEQRQEIERALRDALELTPEELKNQRYADYRMNPDAWTIIELLERYFVSNAPAALDPDTFYEDIKRPEARAAVEEQLRAVQEALDDRSP